MYGKFWDHTIYVMGAVVDGIEMHTQEGKLTRKMCVHKPQVGFSEVAPRNTRLIRDYHQSEPRFLKNA